MEKNGERDLELVIRVKFVNEEMFNYERRVK